MNYTPAPAANITVQPAFVEYAATGTTLAKENGVRPRVSLVMFINGILGGGIAQAAGSCSARAYTDARGTPVAYGSTEGNVLGVYDSTGCFPGALYVTEPGWNSPNTFGYAAPTCSGHAFFGPWSPTSGVGPTATLQGVGQAGGSCQITISGDPRAAVSSGTTQTITKPPCSLVGEAARSAQLHGGTISRFAMLAAP